MNGHKHSHNFALLLLLLSLLFIPVGSFGLAEVREPEVAGVGDVLSVKTTRPLQTGDVPESSESSSTVAEESTETSETSEATTSTPEITPDLVIPFYR